MVRFFRPSALEPLSPFQPISAFKHLLPFNQALKILNFWRKNYLCNPY
jgi:hypothetical protein